ASAGLAVSLAVSLRNLGGNPAAVGDLVPLLPGPGADGLVLFPLGGGGTGRDLPVATATAGRALPASRPAGVLDVRGERIPQLLGVLRRQVDLVGDTVEGKLHRLIGF